ncbi:MAG: HAD-IIB family hydrolase [Bdellovibrionota bacterium]
MGNIPAIHQVRSIDEISVRSLREVRAVFFDIDDTFSGGEGQARILAEAYDALWKLYHAGVIVVPVTGRPAGWCDMIARMWPVSAVVGENGAFYCYLDSSSKPHRFVKKYLESAAVRAANARKLKALFQTVKKKFPTARVASDQHFREFDFAIDYCEDVPRWPEKRVEDLIEFCASRGAMAKLSSIHVNVWYGRYDKWTCVQRVLKQYFRIDPHEQIQNVVYIGDSPNDEPFFSRMPFTVGVANIRGFLHKMKSAPAFITHESSGLGFAEFARLLLETRRVPRKGID